VGNPLSDIMGIIKNDWKLLAGLNALYFCVIIIGATIALISPSLHLSMIQFIGSETIAGTSSIQAPATVTDGLMSAGKSFVSSFFVNTLGIITIPSIILPLWAPIIGAARFFIWGITYVSPLEGILTLGDLLPQYIAMLLEGEAYIVAIFACVRQLTVAIASLELGFGEALPIYARAVAENSKLLIIVVLLLAAAALYQAFIIPMLSNIL
jgi:hypothetical protein